MRKTILCEIALLIIVVAVFALIAGPSDFSQALMSSATTIIKLIFTSLKF